MSCELRIRGPGRPGSSGANTVIVGRIRPPFAASCRCLTDSAATLTGTVETGGTKTSYFFEYGTSKGYGKITASKTTTASGKVSVSARIRHLKAGTKYQKLGALNRASRSRQ